VGCGLGVQLLIHAAARSIEAHGIDYAENMVDGAKRRQAETNPDLGIDFRQASVTELPYDDGSFDVITSHRCLMALLDWELQKQALIELRRVLKPGGTLVLLEGTFDGLERLNFFRRQFGLDEIEAGGRDRLLTLKFHERELLDYVQPHWELVRTQRFGMYYFLTRIVQPLLVAPDPPSYDHELNTIARDIARVFPDLEHMGHLVGFVLRKRP
jgi:ubiquinone/menaquinone biosynthesis C-methylase UbiE